MNRPSARAAARQQSNTDKLTTHTQRLHNHTYSLLLVATPADWRVRTSDKTPHPYWEQLHTWIRCANQLHMDIVIYGPTGFLWTLPGIGAIIAELGLNVRRLHLCHFGDKYDTARTLPSAAYLQIATTLHLPPEMGKCNCGRTAEHVLD